MCLRKIYNGLINPVNLDPLKNVAPHITWNNNYWVMFKHEDVTS